MPDTDQVKDTVDEAKDAVNGDGNGNLKKVLVPAAAGLGSLAVTFAARKATDVMKDRVKPKLEEEGGEEAAKIGEQAIGKMKQDGGKAGLAGKALEKVTGGGGSDGGQKTRRLPIQRWTDVAAPIDVVFEKWTKFDDFPKFMHRVLNVETKDRNKKVTWDEKIWFSKRHWEGEITERRKNERIAWKTTSGMSHKGIVSFHPIADRLTRVIVTMEFEPSGMIEKMASGLRFVKRAVQADLARFKAYVELGDAEGIDYRPADADEPSARERREQERKGAQSRDGGDRDDEERESEREEREKRRQERREKAGSTG